MLLIFLGHFHGKLIGSGLLNVLGMLDHHLVWPHVVPLRDEDLFLRLQLEDVQSVL